MQFSLVCSVQTLYYKVQTPLSPAVWKGPADWDWILFFLHRSRWRALQLSWAPFTADFTGWGDQQEKNRRVMKKTEHAAGADNQRLVLAATARNLWSPWPYMTCWGNDWSEMWLMIKICWSIGHWPSGSCRLIWNEWCGNIWNWATLSLWTATYVVQLSGHGDIMVWYQSNRLKQTYTFNPFVYAI